MFFSVWDIGMMFRLSISIASNFGVRHNFCFPLDDSHSTSASTTVSRGNKIPLQEANEMSVNIVYN